LIVVKLYVQGKFKDSEYVNEVTKYFINIASETLMSRHRVDLSRTTYWEIVSIYQSKLNESKEDI